MRIREPPSSASASASPPLLGSSGYPAHPGTPCSTFYAHARPSSPAPRPTSAPATHTSNLPAPAASQGPGLMGQMAATAGGVALVRAPPCDLISATAVFGSVHPLLSAAHTRWHLSICSQIADTKAVFPVLGSRIPPMLCSQPAPPSNPTQQLWPALTRLLRLPP